MSGLTFSNGTVNLSQVDSTFSEKNFVSIGYSSNDVNLSEYTFSPYIDYFKSTDVIIPSEFYSIRVILIGGGGGGGSSGPTWYTTIYTNNYRGGCGGGGGCAQINSDSFIIPTINEAADTSTKNHFYLSIGNGGAGGGSTVATSAYGLPGATGGTTTLSFYNLSSAINTALTALGGGGGGAGQNGRDGGAGGAGGLGYGWLGNEYIEAGANLNRYRNQSTNGGSYGSVEGQGGYLSGWSSTDATYLYGGGGNGGISSIDTYEPAVVGKNGNSGFARVYFNTFINFSYQFYQPY